jgi:CCR4-NOT transcription complex subunit 3
MGQVTADGQVRELMARELASAALLQQALGSMPESDADSSYQPQSPVTTPSFYPQTVNSVFEQPSTFEKFDTDTLFFIFYYQQGTYSQGLAARELRKKAWRFHKKYLTWFQRHEEPKEISADYEQGTYVYFDWEHGWCQRKKELFTFEYRFLESSAE